MMQGAYFLLTLLLVPGFARASEHVSLNSQVFVERTVLSSNGRPTTVLDQPKDILPGDNLVFLLRYRIAEETPATGFAVTNPMPPAVSFREAKGRAVLVSVDGGKSWGALPELSIRERSGQLRRATPDDVTHIRWTFRQALPPGSTGKLSFRGTVR